MELNRAIELLKIERECVQRNSGGCDRNCAICDLVQEDYELLEMYDYVLDVMEAQKKSAIGQTIMRNDT